MYYSDVNSWLGLGALKWRFGFKCSVEGELSAREAGGAGKELSQDVSAGDLIQPYPTGLSGT